MVQNCAEGKEDIKSVSAEQGCFHTELLIVGNNNFYSIITLLL